MLLRTTPSPFLYELEIPFESAEIPALPGSDETDPECDYSDSQITPEFRPGQIVVHRKFGQGTVRQFTDTGENSIVVVRFNSGQTKSLNVKYANLLKVF
jgi:hypothetical protein